MKGQPPHIGHILTIVRLYSEYESIILYVVPQPHPYYNEEDFIIHPNTVISIFKEVFKYMPKIRVILSKGFLRDRTSFDDLPPFDVVVTGNQDLIQSMKGKKPTRFIPKSKIGKFDINSTMLREIWRKQQEDNQKQGQETE